MIDLHVHTKNSDSSLTVEEIFIMSIFRGITHISITDHDTMQGLSEAIALGDRYGVKVIPGIEISAYDFIRDKRAHILGYYTKPQHPALDRICSDLVERRCRASHAMVQRLTDAGYDIVWDEVEKYARGGTGVYKQHIMHALLDKGYCDRIYSKLYYRLFKRGNSVDTPGLAFVPMQYVDAVDAIDAVKQAGGVAVLAHPGQFDNYDAIDEWVANGLDGIEAYHHSHGPEEIKKSLDYADRYDLVATGGSDFHGFYGEYAVELGCPEISTECIDKLEKRAQNIMGQPTLLWKPEY